MLYMECLGIWIFETAQLLAFSGKNVVAASVPKDGDFGMTRQQPANCLVRGENDKQRF